MWARGIQLLDQDEPGFWESLGYHNYGDPWQKQRFWGTETEVVLTSSDLWSDGNGISGKLLPGASADWQVVLPDGTALGDIRYTLQTDRDELLYVQSWGIRHGGAEVLARLGRGEDVDASEYTFRTATRIETGTPDLDWLNKGVFISVASRQVASVIYETYLVA
jgi:Protein of unknown function (DUF3237)